jgi:hypothetical protein
MGELIFQHWCRSIAANPLKAEFDELGIDFNVTFRSPSGRVIALDLYEPEFSCRIQVKTTDSPRDSGLLKLSKWLSLVNDCTPTFVLLINYDRQKAADQWASGNLNYDDLPVGAFLMPIDEERMTEILRELRAAKTAKVLAAKRTIKARPDEKIPPNGYALREAIRKHIEKFSGDYSKYIPRKDFLRRSIGYGVNRRIFTTDVKWTDEMQGDYVLGLPVPAVLVKIEDVRFEIPREVPIDDPAVQIRGPRVAPPVTDVTISFVATSSLATFKTTMYDPRTVLSHVREFNILFEAGPLVFVLNASVIRITCTFDTEAPLDLWNNAFGLMRMCAAGPVRMSMVHGSARHEQDITIPPASIPATLLDPKISKAIECAIKLASFFDKDVGSVRPAAVADAFEPIGILYSLVFSEGANTLVFNLSENEVNGNRGKHIAVILRPGARIGCWHFSAAIVVHGKVAENAPSGEVTITASCEIVAKFARPMTDGEPNPPIQPLMDAAHAWTRKRRMKVIEPTMRLKTSI